LVGPQLRDTQGRAAGCPTKKAKAEETASKKKGEGIFRKKSWGCGNISSGKGRRNLSENRAQGGVLTESR